MKAIMVITQLLAVISISCANSYRGEHLEKRGVPFPVLPRAEVMACAMEIARSLAEKPRVSLVTLKDHMVEELRRKLPGVTAKEVAMHEKTFHLPQVRERIEALF